MGIGQDTDPDRRCVLVGCFFRQTGLQFCVEAMVAVHRLTMFLVLPEGNGVAPPGTTDKVREGSPQFALKNVYFVFFDKKYNEVNDGIWMCKSVSTDQLIALINTLQRIFRGL